MRCIFGVDIGGTNIKFGKFLGEELKESFQVKTNSNEKDPINPIVKQIVETIVNNLNNDELYGVGIGVPGPVTKTFSVKLIGEKLI